MDNEFDSNASIGVDPVFLSLGAAAQPLCGPLYMEFDDGTGNAIDWLSLVIDSNTNKYGIQASPALEQAVGTVEGEVTFKLGVH